MHQLRLVLVQNPPVQHAFYGDGWTTGSHHRTPHPSAMYALPTQESLDEMHMDQPMPSPVDLKQADLRPEKFRFDKLSGIERSIRCADGLVKSTVALCRSLRSNMFPSSSPWYWLGFQLFAANSTQGVLGKIVSNFPANETPRWCYWTPIRL